MSSNIPDYLLGPPPPGVTPNYAHPRSWAWETYFTVSICLSFLIPFVLMRLYSRKVVTRSMGIDDYLCALSAVLAIFYAAMALYLLDFGYGIHLWDLKFSTFGQRPGSQIDVVVLMLYTFTMILIKTSIFLLYLRIIPSSPRLRALIYIGIVFAVVGNLAVSVSYMTICTPRGKEIWIMATEAARCVPWISIISYCISAVNLASDVYILVLPLPMVWGLQMPFRKQVGATIILMTGLIGFAASLTRMILFGQHVYDGDVTFWNQRLTLAFLVEITVCVICSCMPACAPLLRKAATACPSLAGRLRDWLYSKAGGSSRSTTQKQGSSSPLVSPQPSSKIQREHYLELGEVPTEKKEPSVTTSSTAPMAHPRDW